LLEVVLLKPLTSDHSFYSVMGNFFHLCCVHNCLSVRLFLFQFPSIVGDGKGRPRPLNDVVSYNWDSWASTFH
jgi:hypothetical protein